MPISGIVFVVLLIAGFSLDNTPSDQASAATYATFYSLSGNRTQLLIEAYLLAFAAMAFLVFLVTLQSRARRLEGDVSVLSTLITAGGLLFAATLLVLGTALGAIPSAVTVGNQPVPPGALARFMPQLGDTAFFLFGMVSAAFMVTVTSLAALRLGFLPRWLAWTGFVVAALLLLSLTFFPAIALPLWVLAVSIVLLRQPSGQPAR
jgi:hypothetical protein